MFSGVSEGFASVMKAHADLHKVMSFIVNISHAADSQQLGLPSLWQDLPAKALPNIRYNGNIAAINTERSGERLIVRVYLSCSVRNSQ